MFAKNQAKKYENLHFCPCIKYTTLFFISLPDMVSIVSEKLEKEYDHRIQQTLAELRDFYENQMKTNRAEFTRKVVIWNNK